MKRAAALLAVLLAGCGDPAPLPPKAATPTFDPVAFFAGRSNGIGTLDVILASPKPVRVRSIGRALGANGFRLDQIIWQGSKPPRRRHWLVRQLRPGQWMGTLTDADGPVTLTADGNELRISYRMKNGLAVDQRLRLNPSGRMAANRLTARKWGIRVATLDEAISKLD